MQMQHLASHICPLLTRGDRIFSMGFVLVVLQWLKGKRPWRNTEESEPYAVSLDY